MEFDHNDVVRHPLVSKIGLIKRKALMIKIELITNNKSWNKYFKNPSDYISKKHPI